MERVNPQTGFPWQYGDVGPDGRIFLAYRRKSRINKDGTYQMNWLSPESWKKRKEYYKQSVKEKHNANIKIIQEEKLNRGCACCGYKENPYALDFDHLDPKSKIEGVSRMSSRNTERVKEEMAKCQVLCANCHRIKTHDPECFKTLLSNNSLARNRTC
jgi:hypothetical protein